MITENFDTSSREFLPILFDVVMTNPDQEGYLLDQNVYSNKVGNFSKNFDFDLFILYYTVDNNNKY